MAVAATVVESMTAEFAALFPHLDERQRRLTLAARARSLGHGGIAAVARAAGVSALTVSKGVAELEAGGPALGRTRRPGAGRKPVTEWAAPDFPDSGIDVDLRCCLRIQVLGADFVRGLVAERGVDSSTIVEDLDVACNVVSCFLAGRVDGAVDAFDFERGIE
jgi:hypothetical protein